MNKYVAQFQLGPITVYTESEYEKIISELRTFMLRMGYSGCRVVSSLVREDER